MCILSLFIQGLNTFQLSLDFESHTHTHTATTTKTTTTGVHGDTENLLFISLSSFITNQNHVLVSVEFWVGCWFTNDTSTNTTWKQPSGNKT